MGETLSLRVSVRGGARLVSELVTWALDGESVRALLDALLERYELAPLPEEVRGAITLGGAMIASIDVPLRACLDAALPTRDFASEIELAVDLPSLRASRPPAGAGRSSHRPPTAPMAPGSLGAPRPSPPIGAPGPFAPMAPPSPMAPPVPMAPPSPMAPPTPMAPPAPMSPPPTMPKAGAPPPMLLDDPGVNAGEKPLGHVSRATVEYFTRMTPQRVFPLKVTLSPHASDTRLARDVARAESETFRVDPSKSIEVEPVLPGCTVYPAKLSVPGDSPVSELRFWVVPQVKGAIPGMVYVRHGSQQRVVRLAITVAEPRLAAWTASASVVLPYVSIVMKHARLDFESQLSEDFSAYQLALRAVLRVVGPTELFVALVVASAVIWARRRPKAATAHDALDTQLYAR